MARLPVHQLRTNAVELNLGTAKVYHLPDWNKLTHPQRLVVIRQLSTMRGRDPRIARLAVEICRNVAQPRQYKRQAEAILRWVQDPKNFYYVNEPGERLQDPIYTIKVKSGDCDDAVALVCALFESIGLPWRLCLAGKDQQTGRKIRFIEGELVPPHSFWAHIYCMVGIPPFFPTQWYFCEPTVQGVPLGWDVISGDSRFLPEIAKSKKGPAVLMKAPSAPVGYKPPAAPPPGQRSSAYDIAYGQVGAAVGTGVAQEASREGALDWKRIGQAVLTGVAVSVTTQLVLDWINGRGMWEGRGHVFQRIFGGRA